MVKERRGQETSKKYILPNDLIHAGNLSIHPIRTNGKTQQSRKTLLPLSFDNNLDGGADGGVELYLNGACA